jgi:hypothetical protein
MGGIVPSLRLACYRASLHFEEIILHARHTYITVVSYGISLSSQPVQSFSQKDAAGGSKGRSQGSPLHTTPLPPLQRDGEISPAVSKSEEGVSALRFLASHAIVKARPSEWPLARLGN